MQSVVEPEIVLKLVVYIYPLYYREVCIDKQSEVFTLTAFDSVIPEIHIQEFVVACALGC